MCVRTLTGTAIEAPTPLRHVRERQGGIIIVEETAVEIASRDPGTRARSKSEARNPNHLVFDRQLVWANGRERSGASCKGGRMCRRARRSHCCVPGRMTPRARPDWRDTSSSAADRPRPPGMWSTRPSSAARWRDSTHSTGRRVRQPDPPPHRIIVWLRTAADHGSVLYVRPCVRVVGRRQPDGGVVALIQQVPLLVDHPGDGRTSRSSRDRLTVGLPNIQNALFLPVQAIGRRQQMGDVVAPLREHVVDVTLPHDAHILDPVFSVEWITRRSRPLQSVARRGVAQKLRTRAILVVAAVPQVPRIALAKSNRAPEFYGPTCRFRSLPAAVPPMRDRSRPTPPGIPDHRPHDPPRPDMLSAAQPQRTAQPRKREAVTFSGQSGRTGRIDTHLFSADTFRIRFACDIHRSWTIRPCDGISLRVLCSLCKRFTIPFSRPRHLPLSNT